MGIYLWHCILSHVSGVLLAGKPLDDKYLLPEVSTLFMAGFESELLKQFAFRTITCLGNAITVSPLVCMLESASKQPCCKRAPLSCWE